MRLGRQDVTLRYMTAEDAEGLLAFAAELPEHDLLFLRRDISTREGIATWVRDLEAGIITSVLAEADGRIVGYATIHRSDLDWSKHVAELRVLVAPSMRGKGLGRRLTEEAFAIGLGEGIEKMVARMTLDQKSAVAVFEGLGFRPEALLRDHVKDRSGRKHDLLVLSHEVAKFESALNAYGVSQAFE
jgi:L-amino acid N-acyltransferase YncA